MLYAALGAALLFVSPTGCARAQDNPALGANVAGVPDREVKPFLHPLFSDNAVLQRDRAVPIWGWTTPGARVSVQLDKDAAQSATAGSDGLWTVSLPAHATGATHTLRVSDASHDETCGNLLFGDVWICSGQSNMAYDMRSAKNYQAEVRGANFPEIRLLQVGAPVKATPAQTFDTGAWKVCSPQTVEPFSAVGYFFGRALYQKLKVPIGLIDSSVSGTPAQAWVSGPALRAIPAFSADVDAIAASAQMPGSYAEQMQAWWENNDAGSRAHQEASDFDDADWKTIEQPGNWEDKGFPGFDGVMWFRRAVDVPANRAGRDLQLNLGNIDDQDTTYWNGAPIGATGEFLKERKYTVPGAQVKAGRNVIAIRVLDSGGGGGLAGPNLSMQSGEQTVSLNGAWKIKRGPELKSLPPAPIAVDNSNQPTVLYNSKIAPLTREAIKGIVWYQGESNGDRLEQAIQYRTLLPTLIRDWRSKFGEQTPFYIMQLANFREPIEQASDDSGVWPYLREAQSQTARDLPNVYLTVPIDLGEANNVHYPNKQEAGRRLALTVLEHSYGQNSESSGPTLKAVKRGDGAMTLTFDHAQGLNLKGEASRVFAVAGADLKFSWATPTINGDAVTLRAPDVAAPLTARFGWSDNPRAALYNDAGLPASPFRTDEDARFAAPLAANRADAAFNAWNAAFLVRNSRETYYTRTLQNLGRESEGSWVLALDIEVAQDAYERTRSSANRELVGELLDTFLAQNSYDWAGNTWNDDMAWMSTALIRGYQITGKKAYLDKAAYAWNLAYDRGWDTKYGGGGVWENMDNFVHGDGKADKLALSNTTLVNPGVILYQVTGDEAYLDKSKAIYDWIRESGTFNKATGQVNEGVKWPIGEPDKGYVLDSNNPYNSGSFVQAANALYRITGDKSYYDDAMLAISHVVKTPILSDNGGFQSQWQYRFIKALSEFATDNQQWPQYESWMRDNAEAAWKSRDSRNLTGNNWLKVNADDPKINAMQTSSAAAIWQLLPPANPTEFAGNYTIRNAASRLMLFARDVAGAPVTQSTGNASWTLVPTGAGFYQIKDDASGLVVAVAEASATPLAKVVSQRAEANKIGADQWYPVKNDDGTFSFYNLNSLQALDLPGANVAADTQFGQYFGNDSPAQKFVLTRQ